MKTRLFSLLLVLSISNAAFSKSQGEISDEQFYGQKPPGVIPELYQPGFSFLKGIDYQNLVFSPSGKELCYSVRDTSIKQSIIYYVQRKKGHWTEPKLAYFIPNNSEGRIPQFSPDGKRFSYTYKGDFWSSVKEDGKWKMAEKMSAPVCTDKYECGFSFAASGSIYFAGNGRPEGKGQCDIYCSKLKDNQFGPSINLDSLNTNRSECVVSVSPDEKYIVFTRFLKKDGQNATDLYISFSDQKGNWTLAQKLGPIFNSSGANNNPVFSADGKYFFFSQVFRTDSDNYEINRYWVGTLIFDELYKSIQDL